LPFSDGVLLALQVELNEDIEGAEADELVAKCPVKVFDIEDLGKGTLHKTFTSICIKAREFW
jgi:hypothetical protein